MVQITGAPSVDYGSFHSTSFNDSSIGNDPCDGIAQLS
jgi:hypothetical protein